MCDLIGKCVWSCCWSWRVAFILYAWGPSLHPLRVQEEEQEEEAEEEEQKVSAFTRDDEHHNPWATKVLTTRPCGVLGDEPFYPLSQLQVRAEQPLLPFPDTLWLSDNFFKTRWRGLGDRKLKNVAIVLEWQMPEDGTGRPASPARVRSDRAELCRVLFDRGIACTTCPPPPRTVECITSGLHLSVFN